MIPKKIELLEKLEYSESWNSLDLINSFGSECANYVPLLRELIEDGYVKSVGVLPKNIPVQYGSLKITSAGREAVYQNGISRKANARAVRAEWIALFACLAAIMSAIAAISASIS